MRHPVPVLLVTLASLLPAGVSAAVPIDGRLEPEYGAARCVQTTQTSAGDVTELLAWDGSELDGAYAFVESDTLYLLVTGSFNMFLSEFLATPHQLQCYLDVGDGGQNPLLAGNPDVGAFVRLAGMTGLRFDTEFVPDHWFAMELASRSPEPVFAYSATLPAGAGGVGRFLGRTALGAPGVLAGTGASNPFGIRVGVDLSNLAGVTAGCDASSGAGVTVGAEWAIPLAALDSPAGTLRICALLVRDYGGVTNQVLGPVPPGTCAFGAPSGVDLSTVEGAQYFTVDVTVPTTPTSWGRLKSRYR